MVVLPGFTALTLDKRGLCENVNRFGIACCGILGCTKSGLRGCIQTKGYGKYADQGSTAKTSPETDARCGHAVATMVVPAVTVTALACTSGVPHSQIAGCKIITFHCYSDFFASFLFGY
jgi:hypothetical protein